jgi:hypothetical protein
MAVFRMVHSILNLVLMKLPWQLLECSVYLRPPAVHFVCCLRPSTISRDKSSFQRVAHLLPQNARRNTRHRRSWKSARCLTNSVVRLRCLIIRGKYWRCPCIVSDRRIANCNAFVGWGRDSTLARSSLLGLLLIPPALLPTTALNQKERNVSQLPNHKSLPVRNPSAAQNQK